MAANNIPRKTSDLTKDDTYNKAEVDAKISTIVLTPGPQGIQGMQGPPGTTVHNGATEIQGGIVTERYHLTQAEHTKVQAIDQTVSAAEKATWNGKQNALGYIPVNKSGDTMAGALVAQANVNYATAQMRNVIISTADPAGGNNGDIWLKYIP